MSRLNEPEAYLKSGSNELKILEYNIGGIHLGINILKVSRILDRPEKLAKPGGTAKESVIGLFEDHSHIVPLVDLGMVLGIPSKNRTGRVVVTEFFNEINGFLVDAVEQVLTLTWEQVISSEDFMKNLENPYVLAVVRPTGQENILLLDYEKIVLELAPHLSWRAPGKEGQPFETSVEAGGRTILVAEDSRPVREMLELELQDLGFDVLLARDGEKAWEIFEETPGIALVIADVEMPNKDGLALLGHIRQHRERGKTPVLIYSSIGDIGMKERAKVMEASAHITKLEMGELMSTVLEILA